MIKIFQSVCMICNEIYKVQLVNDDSKYNANGFSTGICPSCMEKRKKRRRKWMEDFVNNKESG